MEMKDISKEYGDRHALLNKIIPKAIKGNSKLFPDFQGNSLIPTQIQNIEQLYVYTIFTRYYSNEKNWEDLITLFEQEKTRETKTKLMAEEEGKKSTDENKKPPPKPKRDPNKKELTEEEKKEMEEEWGTITEGQKKDDERKV